MDITNSPFAAFMIVGAMTDSDLGMKKSDVEGFYCDREVLTIAEGASEIQRETVLTQMGA
jgi:hypothetical protein